MLTTLFFALSVVSPQDLPAGTPNPTYVVSASDLREARENASFELERSAWQALHPRWLEPGASELLSGEDEAFLEEFLSSRNQWTERDLEKWRQYSARPAVPLRFQLRDADSGEVLLAGSHQVLPGVPAAVRDLVQRSVVMELDVEIAQASAIADPVVGTQFAGASLAVELLPVPGLGYQAELAVTGAAFGDAEAIDTGYAAIQGFDRLRQNLAEAGWRCLLVPGRNSVFRLPGQQGRTLELELECGGQVPPLSQRAGESLAVCQAPTLAENPNAWNAEVQSLELLGDTWSSSSGFLAFSGPALEDQIDELQRAVQPLAARRQLSLRVSASGAAGDGRWLDLGGEILVDQPFRFAEGDLSLALVDWDVEVACSSRIADPDFSTLFNGIEGSVSATANGLVDLDLRLSRVQPGQPIALTLSRDLPAGSHGEDQSPGLPADVVAVERPEVSSLAVTGSFQPDAEGKVVIERQAPGFLGRGGLLRVEIQVVDLN